MNWLKLVIILFLLGYHIVVGGLTGGFNGFLFKIVLLCFWFSVGVFLNLYILSANSSIRRFLDKLSYIELVILFGILIFIFKSTVTFLLIGGAYMFTSQMLYQSLLEIDYSVFNILGENANISSDNSSSTTTSASTSESTSREAVTSNNSEGNTANTSSTTAPASSNRLMDHHNRTTGYTGRAGDGLIMALTVGGGYKAAQKAPTLGGKVGAIGASIAAGGIAIIAKNAAGNLSEDVGKTNKFVSNFIGNSDMNNLYEQLESMLQLTGNNGIDLLILIQYLQKIQLVVLPILAYNILLLYINEDKLEGYMLKVLPSKFVNFYINSLRKFKKYGIFIVFWLLAVIYFCNYLSYNYLDF